MAIGGSIESVSVKGRTFAVAADSGSNRKLGGFENEEKANGNGTKREIKTRVLWMMGGLKLVIDDARSDQEFLQGIADGTDEVPIVFNFASGFSYQGKGNISGEIQYDSSEATAELTFSGSGKLTQQ